MKVPPSLSHATLKDKQRALRDGFPVPLTLRVHRALSWLGRAEHEADDTGTRCGGLGDEVRPQRRGDRQRPGAAGYRDGAVDPVRPALRAPQPLVHGGATWNSDVNRAQVRDGAALLGTLLPIFVDLMMDHP